jgi:transposase InsO family protein
MEAVPLPDISAVACALVLIFSWISRFGVPETNTSDHGPQFTSNVWSQLCKMLNITDHQTTAYHPETNSVVKRLHGRVKDVLRACAAAATWAEEYPWVLLGLCAQPREDNCLSPAEAVFGTPIVLPNEILHGEEISVDYISKIFFENFECSSFSSL